MKIALVYDTPNAGWTNEDHLKELDRQIAIWRDHEPDPEYQVGDALRESGHEIYFVSVYDTLQLMLDELENFQPDLTFNLAESFHGNPHLDYLFPATLESAGYRFIGAPPLGLLVTRNKAMSKKVLAYHGIKVPDFITYRRTEEVEHPPELRFPLIVKPLQLDASEGIAQASVVSDVEALRERVAFIHQRFSQPAIAEEFVEGRELYIGVLGNDEDLRVLPATELVFDKKLTKPEERIATQLAKWDEPYRERKGIRNQFARRLSRAAQERIAEICRTAARALWLWDYARLDIRLNPQGEIWVMEANANPFISYGHDIAEAAQKAGLDYHQFIQSIVDAAVARYEHHD